MHLSTTMTPRFNAFIPFILSEECDYPHDQTGQPSNDPSDPGGVTRWGIDKNSHPNVDIINLDYGNAVMIYFNEWQQESIETMPGKLGEVYYNSCVNCGISRAQKILVQASPGTASDFIDYQESFYTRLAAQRPSLAKYLKGWLNRTSDLRTYLKL